jgi:hypothetical protein
MSSDHGTPAVLDLRLGELVRQLVLDEPKFNAEGWTRL